MDGQYSYYVPRMYICTSTEYRVRRVLLPLYFQAWRRYYSQKSRHLRRTPIIIRTRTRRSRAAYHGRAREIGDSNSPYSVRSVLRRPSIMLFGLDTHVLEATGERLMTKPLAILRTEQIHTISYLPLQRHARELDHRCFNLAARSAIHGTMEKLGKLGSWRC